MAKKAAPPKSVSAPAERVSLREAARLLNVTRVYVTQLAQVGQLGAEVGLEDGDRWYARTAVLAYRSKLKKRQAAGLKKMTAASERAGLYKDEADLLELAAGRTGTLQEPEGQHPLVESRVGRTNKATVPAAVLHLLEAKPGVRVVWLLRPDGTVVLQAKTLQQHADDLTREDQPSTSLGETKR